MLKHLEGQFAQSIQTAAIYGVIATHRALLKALITYGEIGQALGIPAAGTALNVALQDLTATCIKNGEPPVTAIVVNTTQRRPGEGFFRQLRDLGVLVDLTPSEEAANEVYWRGVLERLGVIPYTVAEALWLEPRPTIPRTHPLCRDGWVLREVTRGGSKHPHFYRVGPREMGSKI